MFISAGVDKNLVVAAKEAVQVYHAIKHNESFKSMDCMSQIIRTVYGEANFECAKTKTAAIVSGVFEPMILNQIEDELKRAHFVCVSTDASNRKEIKMFPVLFRYYLPTDGVKTRLVELKSLPGEKAKQIVNLLQETLEKWGVKDKTICFCADNCPTNFGNVERTGNQNVYYLLKSIINRHLIGVGCLAHILHNAPKHAFTFVLTHNIDVILSTIYKRFYISTKQTEALKAHCNAIDIEFEKVKGCIITRFLAKKKCINSVLKVYRALRNYYDSVPARTIPMSLRSFFNDPLNKLILILVRDTCDLFETAILKIEGSTVSGIEAIKIIENLRGKLQTQIDEKFISLDAEEELDALIKSKAVANKQTIIDELVQPIHGKFVDTSMIHCFTSFS